VTVIKIVVLVLRIPEHFSLHFYVFSTIFYGIYKFAAFDSSVHVCFSLRPLDFGFRGSPWPEKQRRGKARRFR
jgi:hypothetical protein